MHAVHHRHHGGIASLRWGRIAPEHPSRNRRVFPDAFMMSNSSGVEHQSVRMSSRISIISRAISFPGGGGDGLNPELEAAPRKLDGDRVANMDVAAGPELPHHSLSPSRHPQSLRPAVRRRIIRLHSEEVEPHCGDLLWFLGRGSSIGITPRALRQKLVFPQFGQITPGFSGRCGRSKTAL